MKSLHVNDLRAMIAKELFGLSDIARSSVGLELELLAVGRSGDGVGRQIEIDGEQGGLRAWMQSLADAQGWSLVGDGADPSLLLPGGGKITLEPAGQIEYSGPALAGYLEALQDVDDVVSTLARSASKMGIDLLASGFNTRIPESEQRLVVAGERYMLMDRYFASIGPYGRRMMRSTCALQINLDFGTPAETPGRWRLANMIAPSLNAIFANSHAIVDGRRYRSYRQEIWSHADPTRTGRLYDSPDLDPVDDYLFFALEAGVMFLQRPGGGLAAPPAPMTFADWIAGRTALPLPDMNDWRRHLSTLFPDVRARGYMELRSIDALPGLIREVAVTMVSTLIYTGSMREQAIDRLERRQRVVDPEQYEHDGCWRSDYETGRELLELAIPSITDPSLRRLSGLYLERILQQGLTPGELLGDEGWNGGI